jgi:hypothetical protein
MNRRTEIYSNAIDIAIEQFNNELVELINSKDVELFDRLVKKINRHMVKNGLITKDDVSLFFTDLLEIIRESVVDAMRILVNDLYKL